MATPLLDSAGGHHRDLPRRLGQSAPDGGDRQSWPSINSDSVHPIPLADVARYLAVGRLHARRERVGDYRSTAGVDLSAGAAVVRRSLAALVAAAAWAEAYTRIFLLKHWLTDVAGGLLLGSILLTLAAVLTATLMDARPNKELDPFVESDLLSDA